MARPRKQPQPEATVQPMSDDVEQWHIGRITDAKAELDKRTQARAEASGTYRALIKAAKQAGMNADGITAAIKARTMDADEHLAIERAKYRYLEHMGSPIGTQATFFDHLDGNTSANVKTPADQPSEATARAQGKLAGGAGKDLIDDNPYGEDAASMAIAWKAGFREGQAEAAAAAKGRNGKANGASKAPPKSRSRTRAPKGGVVQPPGAGELPPAA